MGYRLLVWLFLCWMAATQDASVAAHSNLRRSDEENERCPRCDMIFSKVKTAPSGERVQQVHMQERGEPKSGTALMFHGINGALAHTCNFLNEWFGSDSCRLENENYKGRHHTPPHIGLTFDPQLGKTDARCPCHGVDRVEIRVSSEDKHTLPVNNVCRWHHNRGIPKYEEGCWSVGGRPVENFNDVRLCMLEANCDISDDERLQFAIFRDPRAETVSMFLYEQQHKAAMKVNDRVAVVEGMADVDLNGEFDFDKPGNDEHLDDEMQRGTSGVPTWRDRLRPETVVEMDRIVQQWLPPVILSKIGALQDPSAD